MQWLGSGFLCFSLNNYKVIFKCVWRVVTNTAIRRMFKLHIKVGQFESRLNVYFRNTIFMSAA